VALNDLIENDNWIDRSIMKRSTFFASPRPIAIYLRTVSASLRLCGLLLFTAYCFLPTAAQGPDYTRWVNPFIGTGGHGHTFPGATVPFGMVQLSPDTRIDNWDGSSGYHYSDDIIYGFSHTHLSGTGIPDGCDILFMPTVGRRLFAKNRYVSKFSHADEKAEPGYYSVKLDDGIFAELTATERVGFHRYSFPKGSDANLILDLRWRDKVISQSLDLVSNNRVEGSRTSASWAKKQTVYFVAEFSSPFNRDQVDMEADSGTAPDQKGGKYNFRFSLQDGSDLKVKIAISYVSIEGARKNLEAEIPGWDFDKVRADAKAAWNKELSKIEVSGGTPDQMTTFYTALYHTAIQPNVFSDVDGRYLGHDRKIHQLPDFAATPVAERRSSASPAAEPGFPSGYAAAPRNRRHSRIGKNEPVRKSRAFPLGDRPSPNRKSQIKDRKSEQYTVFSLWDTFRAAHPLYTIIDEKRTVDFINTFIRIYEQGGRLPVWELWGEETDTMIGYHAVPVIADAMAKGIKGFDYEKAYAAAKHSAELDHFGLAAYKKRGYISSEDENESVSKTLEYAYDDWCIVSMAETLIRLRQNENRAKQLPENDDYVEAKIADYKIYQRRARNFENLFDPKTKFFRPKRNADFITPFAPSEVTFHFTEGNSWQYSFFVPHDVSRLIELMGGRQQFIHKLDELFETDQKLIGRKQPDITGLIGQYAHGNEPSHHIAYLYNFAHAPSKTQARVRYILDNFYKNSPDGLIGNEDAGQMSAWYVLSASGFYSTTPGQTWYDLGTPLFKEVRYNLENGKTFIIKAPNVSAQNFYINKARWNGKEHFNSYIRHEDIMRGGVLELEMSNKPNDKAFIQFSRMGIYTEFAVVPVISGERVFAESTQLKLSAPLSGSKIYFTTNGSTPTGRSTEYTEPFVIDKTTIIRAITISPSGDVSPVTEAEFYKRPNDWSVKILSPYNSQYTGGGDDAIIDGLRGNANFASGEWQGYQGKTFEAVIDLKRETTVREVGGSFLQAAGSWIWMPDRLEFEFSNDGVNFVKLVDFKPGFPQDEMKSTVREFTRAMKPLSARYVRVHAFNIGKIPAWHPGAGGDPWIFVDEIIIR